ncbi:hypothetical protein QJS10_CPA10g00019 [Acorus calamus]|uniref:Uncharacterized protein n=1 Tax=Acorus calamus TaxID=4465 RepID=A0AAV9DZR4_ACOCL|nr:hypothetical protein QJS10_CPA10g00019 [Acorus calamus]
MGDSNRARYIIITQQNKLCGRWGNRLQCHSHLGHAANKNFDRNRLLQKNFRLTVSTLRIPPAKTLQDLIPCLQTYPVGIHRDKTQIRPANGPGQPNPGLALKPRTGQRAA